MTTRLNERSYAFAQDQIASGHVVLDQRDEWSEHQPSAREENDFIEAVSADPRRAGPPGQQRGLSERLREVPKPPVDEELDR